MFLSLLSHSQPLLLIPGGKEALRGVEAATIENGEADWNVSPLFLSYSFIYIFIAFLHKNKCLRIVLEFNLFCRKRHKKQRKKET